jgi:glutamate---cysteine ligase / carboxylate-amine ligase
VISEVPPDSGSFERMIDHKFTGPPFTIGIEEELMLCEPEGFGLAQEIERVLAAVPSELEGQVKPELLQSVLEIATKPCANIAEAADELRSLRRAVADIADGLGLCIAATGTHPFAHWEEQLVVERRRYRELAEELGYIALRELIFGTHVHVAIEGADKAIYVADGIRLFLPLLLALSANSPFWRGRTTGLASSRTPVFRPFPRCGIPPHYGDWKTYCERVLLMMRAGAIEDYTYMWWDVRPHPNLGTVETRVFDQQTRLDDTIALAALTASLAHLFSAQFDDGAPSIDYPTELIDDNKMRAALRGIEGELVDFVHRKRVHAPTMATALIDELHDHAVALGCAAELDAVRAIVEGGTGSRRQLEIWEREGDLVELMRRIVAAGQV